MTTSDLNFLNKINAYSEEVLGDIDPQKTHVSEQLDKLRPIMEELSKEYNMPLDEVFIKYMDLASEAKVLAEKEFKAKMGEDFDFNMNDVINGKFN